MMLFIVIAFVVFLLLNGQYTIAKKRRGPDGNDQESLFNFTAFMFICTVLWLMMKFAFRSSFFILFLLLFWPNIKKFFKGNTGSKDTS
jgi:hypothetical protein